MHKYIIKCFHPRQTRWINHFLLQLKVINRLTIRHQVYKIVNLLLKPYINE